MNVIFFLLYDLSACKKLYKYIPLLVFGKLGAWIAYHVAGGPELQWVACELTVCHFPYKPHYYTGKEFREACKFGELWAAAKLRGL
jgi:hypothetical protein